MKKISFLLFHFMVFASFALRSQDKAARELYSLNDHWSFQRQESENVSSNGEMVDLPHSWNVEDVMDEERGYFQGVGLYEKSFKFDEKLRNKKVYVYFKGANQKTEVYVNKKLAGKHLGGYTAFCFDITDLLNFGEEGENRNSIMVKVDNRVDPDIPPLSGDFTFYGGIYRDVNLIITDKLHFDLLDYASSGVYIETPELDDQRGRVRIRGRVVNDDINTRRFEVVSIIKDNAGTAVGQASTTLSLKAQQSVSFEQLSSISFPRLWSPEDPYLYQVYTRIIDKKSKELIDEVVNPLGFRWFSFDKDEGFILNGKPYKLIGANRHQDFEGYGNALPDALHERDMRLLKEMGGNFVRISHYPQDPAVLSACDKLGLIVWEEIPIVNAISETESFTQNSEEMLREMVRQHYNHPSVMMWGYMNEVLLGMKYKNEPDRKKEYIKNVATLAQTLENEVRKEDPTRTTVMAFHGNFDLYHDAGLTRIPMVLGWNLYYGWYSADFSGLGRFLDAHREKLPDKLIIVSEYGAGSDTRLHAVEPRRFDFTEQWQQDYLQSYLHQIRERSFVVGGTVWCLADFNSEGRKDTRPHINQKGILQWDRTPKDVYYFHKAALTSNPVLHIASSTWNFRSGRPDNRFQAFCTQPLRVFTNSDSVALRLNGMVLEKKSASQYAVTFDVPFKHGSNRLEAFATVNGKEVVDVQEVQFTLQPYQLSDSSFSDINVNVGAHHYFIDHTLAQVWVPEQAYEKGSWGYIGGKEFKTWSGNRTGSEKDILGTTRDPLYQTQRDSLTGFRFDVADGNYELTLHFAELVTAKEREVLLYNLGAEDQIEENALDREFDVLVNGATIISSLNLEKDYGEFRKVSKKMVVRASNQSGVEIFFKAIHGKPVLNAVQLKKIR